MPNVNQFLPFGTAGGAPVLSNSAYAALPPNLGFPAGILLKEHLNKALRQACVMASAVGQFIADSGIDALDDGNVPNLALALKNALGGNFGVAANPPVTYQQHNTAINVASMAGTLLLNPGTWLIDITALIWTSVYYAMTLSVDGVVVQSMPNLGDQSGTDVVPMSAFATVVVTGSPRTVPIAWDQEAGGNSGGLVLKAIAFKVA